MSHHDEESDVGSFLAGFVIGGLVGAAAALILAPQSGEETRAQLATKGEELRRAGEERVIEYRDMADTYARETQAKVSTGLNDARTKVKDTAEQVQERARIVLDEGKTKVSSAVETGKEKVGQVREQIGGRMQQAGESLKETGEEVKSS
jgi:gas vesicle protein